MTTIVSTVATTTTSVSNTQIFTAILRFVSELSKVNSKNKPLQLYNRLIVQTKPTHDVAVQKHVEAFTNFCTTNKAAILDKNKDEFKDTKITYSPKVFIDVGVLFVNMDDDVKEAVWNHLLFIFSLIDPSSGAKELLLQVVPSALCASDSKEDIFVNKIARKITEIKNMNFGENPNPMKIVMDIIGSGSFTELIDEFQGSDFDKTKLITAIKRLVKTVMTEMNISENDPNFGTVKMMMDVFFGMLENGQTQPDMSSMMSLLPMLMGGMGGGGK
jgi:hypothetical protein